MYFYLFQVNDELNQVFLCENRRYQNGLYPTSHGDHLDRALKSLGKDLNIPVSIDLVNTQAVKVRFRICFFYKTCIEDHYVDCQKRRRRGEEQNPRVVEYAQ